MLAKFQAYFSSEATALEKSAYAVIGSAMLMFSTFALVGPRWLPACDLARQPAELFPNAHYGADRSPCWYRRYAQLGGLSSFEADMCRRLLFALLCGTLLGTERSTSSTPAPVKSMCMVTLGACICTICSMFSELNGPLSFDAARATAQIPKGVGFICSAVLWRSGGGYTNAVLKGTVSSTSFWAGAAIGAMAGGGIYGPALFATMLCVTVNQLGKRGALRPIASEAGGLLAPLTESLLAPLAGTPTSPGARPELESG
mmetsp:Transcript_26074/g.83915  ORF Transcript_26074/g.83915 Transcript_26074/m.83915 type:complete len:258 (+) Transcript_26074:164-937(+)